MAAFNRDPLDAIRELRERYGDLARVWIGPNPVYILNHPDLVEHVVRHNWKRYRRDRFLRRARVLFGGGLLTAEGELWRRQRKLMSPAFSRAHVLGYGETMAEAAGALVERWRDGDVRDLGADMVRVTLEIAAKTLFGKTASADARRIGAAVNDLSDYFARLVGNPIPVPAWLPTRTNRLLRRGKAAVHDVVGAIVEHRRRGASETADAGRRPDLLTMLLDARDDDGQAMSDAQVRDEVLTLLLAGHETTAAAMTYTIHLLARHPEVQRKLHAELDAALSGRAPTPDDLDALPYTRQVAFEGLRLYPPAAVLGRESTQDDVLGEWPTPAGTWVLASQWVVHRDPRFFPNPEAFDPDRWTPDFTRELPRFAYFPFGGGHRVCIGQSFALAEMCLLLATLLQRFEVTPVDDAAIEIRLSLTVRPTKRVHVRLRRRDRPA